jgi:hypothetical protein
MLPLAPYQYVVLEFKLLRMFNMRWAVHVALMRLKRNTYKLFLLGNVKEKGNFGDQALMGENIKIDF